jgi:hypothetical protein
MAKKFNATYQFPVIFKMFNENEKAMQEFHENYVENRRKYTRANQKPTNEEYKIAKRWAEVGPRVTAKEFKISENMVQGLASRVSRYEFKFGSN